MLQSILVQGTEIIEEYTTKDAEGISMEVDVYIPTVKLAVEYPSVLSGYSHQTFGAKPLAN